MASPVVRATRASGVRTPPGGDADRDKYPRIAERYFKETMPAKVIR
jgi:hypothetical protein